jgi:hypothetical protein
VSEVVKEGGGGLDGGGAVGADSLLMAVVEKDVGAGGLAAGAIAGRGSTLATIRSAEMGCQS